MEPHLPELPEEAIAALRGGRTVDAVRIVREKHGLGLKEAAERVDAAVQRDPRLAGAARPPVRAMIGDYLASSYKFPLSAGLGAGAASLYIVGEFFPQAAREYDPGIGILVGLGVPLVVVAALGIAWQRRWRARRAAEAAAPPPPAPAPARAKFAGLPDPGQAPVASDGLTPSARASLDQNDPIAAIKALRAERKLGLAEAKAVVDAALRARKK